MAANEEEIEEENIVTIQAKIAKSENAIEIAYLLNNKYLTDLNVE